MIKKEKWKAKSQRRTNFEPEKADKESKMTSEMVHF